jgi:small-conductance mechanosensitive channel
LFELIHASAEQAGELLPQAIGKSDKALTQIETRASGLAASMRQIEQDSSTVAAKLDETRVSSGELATTLASKQEQIRTQASEHLATLEQLAQKLTSLDEQHQSLGGKAREQLSDAIAAMEGAARDTLTLIDTKGTAGIERITNEIRSRSAEAIGNAIHSAVAEISGQLEQAAAHASGISREATIQLRDQLAKVHELVANLENRVTRARERAEEQVDNDFARRAALITESLNSNAIDIAKAFSAEVSDTAWQGYLKGDRGIFTRRALSLIEASDARSVLQIFERDQDFRELVSRYIHDFEAMLRQVLSTRDGKAMGVTLLSSDMGKLYVALAQAIERLRT